MHIAFLTPEYPDPKKPDGGLGNYTRKVALELIRRGHQVTVFVLSNKKGKRNENGISLHFVKNAKISWHLKRNRTMTTWLDLYEQWLNAQRMKKAVLTIHRQTPFDIVQAPDFKALGFALRGSNTFALVCRCSSYLPMLNAINGIQRNLPEAVAHWMEARQVCQADAAFAPSKFIANTYERMEGAKLQVIHTPLDFCNLNQDVSFYHRIAEGKKYLLFFGALNRVKGVDVLIKAAPEILSKYPEMSIIFIGRDNYLPDGVKALDSIKNSLTDYLLEDRVIYSPPLPKEQLFPIIQHAIGVILPSRVDNYPNTCLESLALGIPVVASNNSSLDEQIMDGKTGFLFKNGDINSLIESIDKLLALSSVDRQKMCDAINQEIKRISSEDRVGQLVSYYENEIIKKLTA